MSGTAEIIIGIILTLLGIGLFITAWIWKNRSDPSVDWTWWQIILLVTGFIIFLIGLILIGVGIYKTIRRKEIPKLEIKEIPKLEIKEIPKPEIPLSLINK